MHTHDDFTIIGAGIIGMATALALQARFAGARIAVLEKEPLPAQHQSARNSGVIHAGVYYAPGSLKARFCREGVAATQAFCDAQGLDYQVCGKLIVATHEHELSRLEALATRARANGLTIEDLDQQAIRQAEPHIAGLAGLYSPATGIVNYGAMTHRMAELFTQGGGQIRYGCRLLSGEETPHHVQLQTTQGRLQTGQLISCAGLYSDRVIRALGQQPGYRIIPFRGEFYRIHNQPHDLVRHLIYPVPDPTRPFLGVHLTRKLDGGFTVGPNAVLAFKREGYRLQDIALQDLASTLGYGGFWRMLGQNLGAATSELSASASKRLYLKRVQRYCPRVRLDDLAPYPAGVRAQAVSPDGKIIDDFLFIQTPRCLHVGNAPSPAATAALPIAQHIVDQLGR